MKKSPIPVIDHISPFLDYCDVVKGMSSQSIENYHRFLQSFIRWLAENNFSAVRPHQLSVEEHILPYRVYLSRHKSDRHGNTLKKSTQNYYLIALRSLLKYFAKRDIVSLPADRIELAKQKGARRVKFLDIGQVRRLFDAPNIESLAGARDAAILEVLFSTGLRVGELVALNREQLNESYIQKKAVTDLELPVTGKGSQTRTVYFSDRALSMLVLYLNKRRDMDPALFVNVKKDDAQDSRRLTARSIERMIKKYVKIAGLPIETTPHTLRHSFATDLLQKGADLRTVQEFLGHRNVSTTQIYTHVTNKRLRDIHRKLHGADMEE